MSDAYLQITLDIKDEHREAAAGVYKKYRQKFLDTISGARSKELLVRDEDVQVLHGFEQTVQAEDYLDSEFFNTDVVGELKPLLAADPEIRIYTCA